MKVDKKVKQVYGKTLRNAVIIFAVYAVFELLFQTKIIGSYYQRLVIQTGIFIISALGLNLIMGFTGQFSLGHAGFMSVGAYVSAILTANFQVPFFLSLLAAAAVSGLLAFVTGYPLLRLKGDYLAIGTLGLCEIIKICLQNVDYVGGARGFTGIKNHTSFTYTYLLVVICFAMLWNLLKNSSKGRAIISIREDEISAEAMGVDITKYKTLSFVIGCAMAGLAGGLYAHFNQFIDPQSFNFSKSYELMMYVVLGGMGSLSGTVVGTGILIFLPEVLRGLSSVFKEYRMLIYAVLLIVMMLFRPQGIVGQHEISLTGIKEKFAGKRKKAGE